MKVVHVRVPEALHELLEEEARRTKRPIQDIVSEALRARLMSAGVDPSDPIFTGFPLVKAKGRRRDNISERHDEILYGAPE
jgi:16S rRNA C1402 (ribose-2'-O) methylase RsmI